MVKCKDCGTEYEGEFCPECGLPAERICPQCGRKGESGARFCNVCGYAFDAKHAADVSFGRDELVKTANAMATDKIIATFFKYAVVGLFGLLSLLMSPFMQLLLIKTRWGWGFRAETFMPEPLTG